MPLYRFLIHGRGVPTAEGSVGFYTTRWTFGRTQEEAATKAIEIVSEDWTRGLSSGFGLGPPTSIEVEEGWRIGIHEIWSTSNKGNTLYMEGDDE